MNLFAQYIILVPIIAWFTAVIIKGFYGLHIKKFSVGQTLGSGGMPSVHSALVTSVTTALGIKYGVFSDIFSLALVFSMIIIYDAINVRFEAGLHAKALNEINFHGVERRERQIPHKLERRKNTFNESIGHLPEEAFAGSVIGIIVAMVLMNV
ncbi:MAG: divergent PAP2 family protein [Candidatus Gracilibacteria bacterium]|nr:divergent PAP2 family protein [Candidatus Gracilibacteria bacterium]